MFNPPNPYHATSLEWWEPPPPQKLVVREDTSRTILSENRSPDVPFRWSLNPYRGCTHACAYCYARRTHEHLDHGAGSDFERVIYVKRDAPALLEAAFARRSWVGEPLNIAGVTDAWQPLERRERITRGLLEVIVAHRQPLMLITRNPLVLRDLDLLAALIPHNAVRATLSLPLLDPALSAALEPGAPPPAARLRAVRALADAGVPVGVSLAPVIPGLNDHALPATLEAARDAGACWAFMSLLRLPGSVREVFEARLREAMPERAPAVLARLARAREGQRAPAAFGARMAGADKSWEITRQAFELARRRLGLDPGDDARFAFPAVSSFQRQTPRPPGAPANAQTNAQTEGPPSSPPKTAPGAAHAASPSPQLALFPSAPRPASP